MTIEHIASDAGRHAAGVLSGGSAVRENDAPASGLAQWVRLLVQRHAAAALLRRTLRRPRRMRLDELSPYLRNDIGLPPDVRF